MACLCWTPKFCLRALGSLERWAVGPLGQDMFHHADIQTPCLPASLDSPGCLFWASTPYAVRRTRLHSQTCILGLYFDLSLQLLIFPAWPSSIQPPIQARNTTRANWYFLTPLCFLLYCLTHPHNDVMSSSAFLFDLECRSGL